MRSVQYSTYGGPEVLSVRDTIAPHAGEGQVVIKVRAAGVNPIDHKFRSGAMAEFAPVKMPHTPGFEVTGTVDSVGEGVHRFAVGDPVFGRVRNGGYTEYALADVDAIFAKPADLPWEVAAGLALSAEAAFRALEDVGVAAGDTVVINGASGGVGALAVQFARDLGAVVIGTGRASNHDYLRELGATPVTYGEGLADRARAAAPGGVQAAVDVAGHGALGALVELVGGTERVVTLADSEGAERHGVRFSGGGPGADRIRPAVELALRLHTAGSLRFEVGQSFPLSEAAAAHQTSEAGHAPGRLVLSVG